MPRLTLLCVLFCIITSSSFAQTVTDKQQLDSALKNDMLMKMLDSMDNSTSNFKISVGFSNKLLSERDQALNTLQNNKQLVFIPSVGYFHKSGLSLSFATYLITNNSITGFDQSSLTPAYDYTNGKTINGGISYTRYFVKNNYNASTSPIQNDFYWYANFKMPWLKPGIAMGYSTGTYSEIVHVDTTVRIQNQNVRINFIDTVTTKLKSFSLIGTLEHSFIRYHIFNSANALNFTPQLLFNLGKTRYDVSHKSSAAFYNAYTKKKSRRIRNFDGRSANQNFTLQSLGLNLDLVYTIGKFSLEPTVYLDYYIPKTTDNRFTQLYAFNVSFSF
ncbi:MAG: hypothetical protein H0W12_12170 [Chitinophagaceae bacterium]|nr:hypothetical protein [Chitinophagaceae bacterium]